MTAENMQYLRSLLGNRTIDSYLKVLSGDIPWNEGEDEYNTVQSRLEAMKRYGKNRWWESQDAEEIVKRQESEEVMLVPFGVYKKAVEKVLQRKVTATECLKRLGR